MAPKIAYIYIYIYIITYDSKTRKYTFAVMARKCAAFTSKVICKQSSSVGSSVRGSAPVTRAHIDAARGGETKHSAEQRCMGWLDAVVYWINCIPPIDVLCFWKLPAPAPLALASLMDQSGTPTACRPSVERASTHEELATGLRCCVPFRHHTVAPLEKRIRRAMSFSKRTSGNPVTIPEQQRFAGFWLGILADSEPQKQIGLFGGFLP